MASGTAVDVLERLKLWQRLAIFAALGVVLVAPPLAVYVSESAKDIETASIELAGVAPARTLLEVIRLTQQHRGLSGLVPEADGKRDGRRGAKQLEVDAAMKALASLLRANAGAMLLAADLDRIDAAWQALLRGIDEGRIKGAETLSRHTRVVSMQLRLLDAIADHFRLSLDPEGATYHLVVATLVDGPALAEAAGQLRGWGTLILARKRLSEGRRLNLVTLLGIVADRSEGVVKALQRAAAATASADPQRWAIVQSGILEGAERIALTVREHILEAAELQHPPLDFHAQASGAIEAQYAFLGEGLDEIEGLLHKRAASLERRRLAMLAFIALMVLAAAWTGTAVARSILRQLGSEPEAIAALAQRLAQGEFGVAIAVTEGDRHSAVAALKTMQGMVERASAARTEAERERTSVERFFQEAPLPMAVLDLRARRVIDANRAAVALSGHSRAAILAGAEGSLGLFLDPAERADFYSRLQRDGSARLNNVAMRGANGRPFWVHLNGNAIAAGEQSGAYIVSAVEVTALHEVEEALAGANTMLEARVRERTAQLTEALETLRAAQDQLIRSEKMAALGRLVAGVAHELNTPIGNGLLSATTLHDHTETFAVEAASGGLRRSALAAYVAQSREASAILVRNLDRAAELIRSFKNLAADQASSQRRSFELHEVVQEVVLAHRPMLKRSPIEVGTDIAAGIRLDGYPGPLGQVLGNLITNAVLHGYEGYPRGSVSVSARLDGEDSVEIVVRDDGCGISETNLKRIFDPFFTTRLGRGGTGLGLGICHNIVTETLGGTIGVASRLDEGATFTVRIPLRAPTTSEQQAA